LGSDPDGAREHPLPADRQSQEIGAGRGGEADDLPTGVERVRVGRDRLLRVQELDPCAASAADEGSRGETGGEEGETSARALPYGDGPSLDWPGLSPPT